MRSCALATDGRQDNETNMAADGVALFNKIKAAVTACCMPESAPGRVSVFVHGGTGGYQIQPIGMAGSSLERSNYAAHVLAAFDHVVADLNSPTPCGRLIILNGEPGCGKSYFVRGLLQAVNAAFVLVPPHLVRALGDPTFLPTIMKATAHSTWGPPTTVSTPLVLLIEDGDDASSGAAATTSAPSRTCSTSATASSARCSTCASS